MLDYPFALKNRLVESILLNSVTCLLRVTIHVSSFVLGGYNSDEFTTVVPTKSDSDDMFVYNC